MTRARVIGIGQEMAGDDGVGPAILRALKERGVPSDVELHVAAEPTAIIPLLETPAFVVLVDAVVGAEPGEVLDLGPEEVERRGLTALSTHGVGVMEAIAMARLLSPTLVSPGIQIVGVGIRPPQQARGQVLSLRVAAAIPRAVERVLQKLEGAGAERLRSEAPAQSEAQE